MVIDFDKEDVFLLSEGPKVVGKSKYALYAYINRGVTNHTTGTTTFLDSIQMPEGLATSKEAYIRFIKAINGL